jgi:transposase
MAVGMCCCWWDANEGGEVSMAAAVGLREDYSVDDLRRLACKARRGGQARRLLALAAIADGQSRAEAAAIGLMDRQTLREWVIRFNAEGPAGLINKSSPGRPPKLTPTQKQEMRQWVEEGPGPHDPRLVRWRRADLAGVIRDRFGLVCHPTTIGRMLRELGFSHVSPRPRHPEKDDHAAEAFKNVWPAPGLQA